MASRPASLSDRPLGEPSSLPADAPPDPLPSRPLLRGNVVLSAWLMLGFACLALVGVNAWLVTVAYGHELTQINLANSNLARAVAQQVDSSVSETEHILDSVVFDLQRSRFDQSTFDRLQPVLVNHVAQTAQLKGLFVYDRSGRWMVSSEVATDTSFNNSDRDYFIYHRDNPSNETRLGLPLISRSSAQWVIPVSRRIVGDDGSFAGVALATLNLTHFRELLARFDVGRQGTVTLIHGDRLLLRLPFNSSDTGRQLPPSALWAVFAGAPSGTTELLSPLDGVERIVSFDHTRNYPILVTVAVGKEEALQNWKDTSVYQSVVVVALCLVLFGAGTVVIRSMQLRLDAEKGLRETRDALTEANQSLAHLARYDGLTGLPNRRYFDMRSARVFAQAQRQQRAMGVVMVDVDEFKQYNDFYGHVAGDECLKRIADAVRLAVRRPEDFVARYGGEEMVLLLPETNTAGATAVAEAVRLGVNALRLPHAKSAFGYVSVSLGVASWTPGLQDQLSDMVNAADGALYKAKQTGRNRVHLHTR